MDLAYTIHCLVPGAIYGGSTSANTQEAYDALRWEDERPKPTWAEIQTAWNTTARPKVAAKATARQELNGGYVVTPEGWSLRTTTEARGAVSDLVQLVGLLLELGKITTGTLVTILDATGAARQVTALRLREIAGDYGQWVMTRELTLRG
jgi:ferric-dicitrate binding protein FerR (iron transport regulator)